jgi:hypothetical protein
MHQKQPPAKVAVSATAGEIAGMAASGGASASELEADR